MAITKARQNEQDDRFRIDSVSRDAIIELEHIDKKCSFVRDSFMLSMLAEQRNAVIERMGEGWSVQKWQEENFEKLMAVSRHLGINRIFLGRSEIVGADDVRFERYPAVWKVGELLEAGGARVESEHRLKAGAGNSDQSQIWNGDWWFGKERVNRAWDTVKVEEIDVEPFRRRMVVTERKRRVV